MKVSCPSCSAKYNVDENRIPLGGLRMRCPKCGSSFRVTAGGIDASEPSAGAGAAGGVDLPVPKAPAGGDGGVDLPVPKAPAGGDGGVDLPVPKAPAGGDGGVDLPVPKAGPGPGGVDLPVPKTGSGPGGVDLPVPMTGPGRSGVDLPVPKTGGGEVSELPVPRPPGAPSAVDLPTPQLTGAGGVDLPTPSMDDYRGSGAGGVETDRGYGAELPLPDDGSGFGEGEFMAGSGGQEQNLPVPSQEQLGHLPVPAEVGDEDMYGYGDFVPAAPSPDDRGSVTYSAPEEAQAVSMPGLGADAAAPGVELGEIESYEEPGPPSFPAPAQEPAAKKKAKKAKKPRKKGTGKRALLGSLFVLLLVIVGGGVVLGLVTPWGFFGSELIIETFFPGTQDDALTSPVVHQAEKRLAFDTYADHRDAIRLIEAKRREGRTGEGLAAYLVFLYELNEMRYGRSAQYAAASDRLCETELRLEEAESPATLLAAASRALKADDVNQARRLISRLLAASGENVDGLHLKGEAELRGGNPAKAAKAFTKLAEVEDRSPRSLFGLARSHLAQDDTKVAQPLLDELLKANPNHVGGLLEQARLAAEANDEDRALTLIDQVQTEKADYASPLGRARGLVLKGDIMLRREKLDDALEAYREASKLNDQSLKALLGMGQIHQRRGNVAEALANYKLARGLAPDNLEALLGVSEALISSVGEGNLKKAQANLEEALRDHPEEPRIHYLLGKSMEELNRPEEATASYEKAIELNKAYLEPYIALSDLLLRRERVAEAMDVLDRARREMPRDPRIATSLGRGYLERNEYTDAEQQFRQALRVDPNHLPALFSLGVTLRRMGRLNDARATFERLSRVDPQYPGLVIEQGLVLERTGQPERALAIYRRELERDPDNLDMKLRVAAALVLVGNCEEAMILLSEVIRQRPDSAEALFYSGRCMLASGQIAEAERALTRAVDIEGENGNYRAYLGWASLEMGNLDRAASELQRAVDLDPTNPIAMWQRGVLLLRSAAPQSAVRDLERALELNPDLREVYHYLALAYDQMRRPDDAIRYFEMAIEYDPQDFESHFTLAQIITDQRGARAGLPLYERAVQVGRRIEPTPRHYYDALFSYGATLHQVGRNDDALVVLREYLAQAPSNAVDREEAVELVRLLSGGMGTLR